MMLRIPIHIVGAAIVLVGAGFLLWHASGVSSGPTPSFTTGTVQEQESYWKNRIAVVDGTGAYEEFAMATAALSPGDQHQDAHAFGAALFEVEGQKGLSVCDNRYSFGCFHEFLGRAIATLGLDALPSLNQACRDALPTTSLSCQHGIGHGVLSYFGYSDGDLEKALDVCRGLPYNDPIGGCYGGVFMEYNVQTMLGTNGKIRDPKSDLQFPCDTVDSSYKEACIFWQPQWWHQLLKQEGSVERDIFAHMGLLCDEQKTSDLVRVCYQGVGNVVAPPADFDPKVSATFCETVSHDPSNQLYCKSFAANSLTVGGAGKTSDGLGVCEGLSGRAYEYCAAYARNEANIAAPIDQPAL